MNYTLEDFKKDHRTKYLADEYERLNGEVARAAALAVEDASMADLAKEEETQLRAQQAELLKQMGRRRLQRLWSFALRRVVTKQDFLQMSCLACIFAMQNERGGRSKCSMD